ncbi:MAG: ferredoxin [Candidatus Nealsonbacteria bacterium]
MAKIILDRSCCIGCGSCQAVCPKRWKLAEDGKAELLGGTKIEGGEKFELETDDVGCTKDAADSCPIQCINVL